MEKLYAALILCTLSAASYSHQTDDQQDINELKREVLSLKTNLLRLETLMLDTKNAVLASSMTKPSPRIQWGCYMDDISAGGVYGSGATEAEAKGKTMESCHQKDGSCWEKKMECTVSK